MEGRWEITKKAYVILILRRKKQKGLPGVPWYIREEVQTQLEELGALPKCLTCHLPKEFCVS